MSNCKFITSPNLANFSLFFYIYILILILLFRSFPSGAPIECMLDFFYIAPAYIILSIFLTYIFNIVIRYKKMVFLNLGYSGLLGEINSLLSLYSFHVGLLFVCFKKYCSTVQQVCVTSHLYKPAKLPLYS